MTDPKREELLRLLGQVCEACPKLRFGQLIANLAVVARGAESSAVWNSTSDRRLGKVRQ